MAAVARTWTGAPRSVRRSASAMLCAAIAAVPWPMTTIFPIRPPASPSRTEAGTESSPSTAARRPPSSRIRPRSVLRMDDALSTISLSR